MIECLRYTGTAACPCMVKKSTPGEEVDPRVHCCSIACPCMVKKLTPVKQSTPGFIAVP
eukprot:CAMPEP_0172057016 /NCGR_PEP_ID=MMETSP1043-20130122/6111_1 /TAXON_ID=464988 /ORGANISM="Hemiselmis andersenii, Strain CCMP441" /LENGTH=58 /DNA_ID=CAMNT_0012716497 /DNA_START=1257 /DNA_END=1429 /DNA_ORIENTATION=-